MTVVSACCILLSPFICFNLCLKYVASTSPCSSYLRIPKIKLPPRYGFLRRLEWESIKNPIPSDRTASS